MFSYWLSKMTKKILAVFFSKAPKTWLKVARHSIISGGKRYIHTIALKKKLGHDNLPKVVAFNLQVSRWPPEKQKFLLVWKKKFLFSPFVAKKNKSRSFVTLQHFLGRKPNTPHSSEKKLGSPKFGKSRFLSPKKAKHPTLCFFCYWFSKHT